MLSHNLSNVLAMLAAGALLITFVITKPLPSNDGDLSSTEVAESIGPLLTAAPERLKEGYVEVRPGYGAPLYEPNIDYPNAQREMQVKSGIDIFEAVKNVIDLLHEERTWRAGLAVWNIIKVAKAGDAQERELKDRYIWNSTIYDESMEMLNKIFADSETYELNKEEIRSPEGREEFKRQTDNYMRGLEDIVAVSPMGTYLRWDKAEINGQSLITEATEIVAKFRALGFGTIISFASKFISLIKYFKSADRG